MNVFGEFRRDFVNEEMAEDGVVWWHRLVEVSLLIYKS